MIIRTPSIDDASGHVAEMYEDDLRSNGEVLASTRALALNPAAHAAFVALLGALVPVIGLRAFELATLGAARAIPSPHCLLAHTRSSLERGLFDTEDARLFADGRDEEAFELRDLAVIRYAARLSTDPTSMTDADVAELREVGFDDEQIVAIALAAGARNLLGRTLLALAVPVEPRAGIPADLQDALLRSAVGTS